MKKLIILFITIITLLFIPNVYAEDVSIESIALDSKSDTTTIVNEATFSNLKIHFDVKFIKKDDFIKYKVVINNKTNEDFIITNTKNNNESEYIKYEYSYDDNNKIVEKNKKTTLFITIKYDKPVPEDLLLSGEPFTENNSIVISLGNEINPETGRIIFKALILIILILGITLTIYVNKINKKTLGILLIGSLIIPISVNALKQISINVESKVTIEQPLVFYVDNKKLKFDSGMTWDEWINSRYNMLMAHKQNYHEYTTGPDGEFYSYFDNNEYGIIIDEAITYCGELNKYTLYSYSYIKDGNKNVKVEDEIINNHHYRSSGVMMC